MVVTKLNDVNYRIRRSPHSKPRIVHGDNLKRSYGLKAEDLGFPSQSSLGEPAETIPEPSLMEAAAPEGMMNEPKELAPPGDDDSEQAKEVIPEVPQPQRKPRVHKRTNKRRAAPEPPEIVQIPSTPLPPTRTRAGREVHAPRRYGWE